MKKIMSLIIILSIFFGVFTSMYISDDMESEFIPIETSAYIGIHQPTSGTINSSIDMIQYNESFEDETVGNVLNTTRPTSSWYTSYNIVNSSENDIINITTKYSDNKVLQLWDGTQGYEPPVSKISFDLGSEKIVKDISFDLRVPSTGGSKPDNIVDIICSDKNGTNALVFFQAFDLLGWSENCGYYYNNGNSNDQFFLLSPWDYRSIFNTEMKFDWFKKELTFIIEDTIADDGAVPLYSTVGDSIRWINFSFSESHSYYTLTTRVRFDNLTISIQEPTTYVNSVTRQYFGTSERDWFNATAVYNHSSLEGLSILRVPVSTEVQAIEKVWNATTNDNATEVYSMEDLTNNTYYYDSAYQFVYIGTTNITYGMSTSWSVNCSNAGTFAFNLPSYKKVGDDIFLQGVIRDDNKVIDGIIAYSHILYKNRSIAVGPSEWNVTNGNFQSVFPTTSLKPGTYIISINYTNITGYNYKKEGTLYLSTTPSGGIYTDATVHFTFYNTNVGLGLPWETLKIYINNTRQYTNSYKTYIGKTINLIIRDYYDNKMLDYNFTVSGTTQFLDLGLTFHSWRFGNSNEDWYMVSLQKSGATRWWERSVMPYGDVEFLVPSGTYCLRIYDDANVEIYNSSLPASLSVVNSKGYVIFGTNLSEIINGQSVIKGDLLELQNDLDDATRVDIKKVMTCPPIAISMFEDKGITLAGTELICPPIIYTAETVNQSFLRSSNTPATSHAFIPQNSSSNGTITVVEDDLYISANSSTTFITLTYAGNTTNYSYVPATIRNLKGTNVSIICDGNVSITRVTRYQAADEFDWTKYTATSKYTATVDIKNPFTFDFTNNDTIYNVYCMMGFANDTTPDYDTVALYDVTNGVFLTQGVNYGYTADAIQWKLPYIKANVTRTFRANYTASVGAITPSTAVKIVSNYDTGTYNDENYWYFQARWVNSKTTTFVGTLDIQFNFTTPKPIAGDSFVVYDEDHNKYLGRDEFIYHGGGVTITQDTLGSVPSKGARNFEVYFLFQDVKYPGLDTTPDDGFDYTPSGENPLLNELNGIPWGYIIAGFFAIIAIIVQWNTGSIYKGGKVKINTITWISIAIAIIVFLLTR